MTITRSARNRALKLSALGAYAAIAAIAACSSDPSAPVIGGHAGAPTAGASGAGAPGAGAPAAGAPGAGAPAGAGADAGGAPGGGGDPTTGGAPGAGADAGGAPGAGAGGAPIVIPPFCDPTAMPVQPRLPLPFTVNTAFIPSNYQNIGNALGNVECPAGDRAPGAIGQCRKWSYTMPQDPAAPPAYVGVGYVRKFDDNYTHPPVCIADGATNVNFYAKGAVGGEKITVTAQGAAEVEVTLTTAWALYQIPLTGVLYNTDSTTSGAELGFFWKIIPATAGAALPVETFSIDSIQWVGTTGTGGAGGASGGGAAGTGGAGAGGLGGGGTGGV